MPEIGFDDRVFADADISLLATDAHLLPHLKREIWQRFD
jgi:hypothetical protein